MPPPTTSEILESARLAVATYFDGSDSTRRVLRFDLENLRSLLRSYDAAQETAILTRPEQK